MNDITVKQNSEINLKRLAAQRRLYQDGKAVVVAQVVVTTVVPLLLTIAASIEPGFRAWASLSGFLIALLDSALLDPLQRALKAKAALVQELFDCDVLSLSWNDLTAGNRPDPEDVAGAARRGMAKSTEGLRDWYPSEIRQLPLAAARIVCQRTNCWWDAKLRRHYRVALIAWLSIISVVAVAASVSMALSVEDFILQFMAPLTPMFIWGIREAKRQAEAIQALERLKSKARSLWERVVNGDVPENEMNTESRALQDGILDRRRSNSLIFDWVYWAYRGRFEDEMTKGAEEMVAEVSRARQV